MRIGTILGLVTAAAGLIVEALATVQAPPGYLVAVASEAADRISLVRFANGVGRVESEIATGHHADRHRRSTRAGKLARRPLLLRHARARSAVRHGAQVRPATRAVVGRATLGLFPATLDVIA